MKPLSIQDNTGKHKNITNFQWRLNSRITQHLTTGTTQPGGGVIEATWIMIKDKKNIQSCIMIQDKRVN